jgi:hypothetical protein
MQFYRNKSATASTSSIDTTITTTSNLEDYDNDYEGGETSSDAITLPSAASSQYASSQYEASDDEDPHSSGANAGFNTRTSFMATTAPTTTRRRRSLSFLAAMENDEEDEGRPPKKPKRF